MCRDPIGGANVSLTVKRCQYSRYKAESTPASPTTLAEMKAQFALPHVFERYGTTPGKSVFYRGTVETDTYGFSVFATGPIADQISKLEERIFFADGTFSVVPAGCFKQLYIIHVKK